MTNEPKQTTIRGNPEILERLRTWAEPMTGPIPEWHLSRLQSILEDAADATGMVPQYRKLHA